MSNPAFSKGEKVWAYDIDDRYRRAIITSDPEWYGKGNCWGYYITWDPIPTVDPVTGIMPSLGGWKSERLLALRGLSE